MIIIKKLISIFILFSIMLVSCTSNDNTINIYVENSDLSKLILQTSDIPKENLEEIISKTISRNKKSFNQETKVLSVTVKDKIAYVDLSKEFDDPNTNSSALARLKVFSIVNGLCLNKSLNIDGVYFIIEGQQQESVAGMIPPDGGPFTANEDL